MLIVVESFAMIKDVLATVGMYIGVPLSTMWIWQEFKDYIHLLSYLCSLKNNNRDNLMQDGEMFSPSVFNTFPKYDVFD